MQGIVADVAAGKQVSWVDSLRSGMIKMFENNTGDQTGTVVLGRLLCGRTMHGKINVARA